MREASRILPFLYHFKELWELCPDLRFGQVYSLLESYITDIDPFYMEDPEWLDLIKRVKADMEDRCAK